MEFPISTVMWNQNRQSKSHRDLLGALKKENADDREFTNVLTLYAWLFYWGHKNRDEERRLRFYCLSC